MQPNAGQAGRLDTMMAIPVLVRGGRGGDLFREKGLVFGEIRDIQSLRQTEIVPFDIRQGLPVLGIEQAKHFAPDPVHGVAGAQLESDTVADLDFVKWTTGIRHGASRMILSPYMPEQGHVNRGGRGHGSCVLAT